MCQLVLTNNVSVEQKPSSGSLGGNVAKLVSSRIAAQAITFAAAPVIARLYSPDSFGVFQIFASIAGVITIVSCLRYELSIPLGKDEKEASASFLLSLVVAFAFTLIILAIVPLAKGKVSQWFSSPELKVFLWVLPIIVFLSGASQILRYWAAREERFGGIAWSDFSRTSGNVLIAIAYALIVGSSVTGLFVGYFAGTAFSILVISIFLSKKLLFDIRKSNLNFGDLKATAIRYKKFPGFDTWSGLLNSISVQLPPIIFGFLFSTTIVGYYSLGYRLVSLPMALLGTSFAHVFFPAAAKEYNKNGSLHEIVSNMFRRLVQIGIFPLVTLGLLGMPLFRFLFGESWTEAGVYTQILSGYVLFQFVSSPLSVVFAVLQRQGTGLIFNIVSLVGRTSAIVLGAKAGGARSALAAYSMANILYYSFICYWVLRNSRVPLWWALKTLFKYICASSLILVPASLGAYLGRGMPVVLLGFGFAVIVYLYGLYCFDHSFQAFVLAVAKRLHFSWQQQ